jgi:hypothetical protein
VSYPRLKPRASALIREAWGELSKASALGSAVQVGIFAIEKLLFLFRESDNPRLYGEPQALKIFSSWYLRLALIPPLKGAGFLARTS